VDGPSGDEPVLRLDEEHQDDVETSNGVAPSASSAMEVASQQEPESNGTPFAVMQDRGNSLSLSSPVPVTPRTKPESLSMSEDFSSVEYRSSDDAGHDRKRECRDWKANYIRRRHIEANWREGRHKVQTFPGHTSTRVRCLQFDDDKLAMGSFDQKCVRVLDFQTRRSLQELVGHTGGVMSLKFDRNILLSASRDRTVKMWDMTTGVNAATFTEHVASVWCLDWDGGFNCVSGSEDRLVKLWDLKSGKCIHTYTGHTKGIGSITFDSRYVASGSRDKTIRLWDQRMRRCLHTYKGHSNSVRCLSFDERKLVSGSWDNTIKIWDLTTGGLTRNLKGHTDRVLTLQFDDYKIVSGSFDQTVKIWDIETGVCQRTLGHHYPLAHIQFDESKIISGSRDLTVRVWDFS
jgi:WD40 repeat protein